tara:strand:- start:108 stop:215 length:108 start_codon:yes stop_codon:yes gene_type:complete
MVGWKHFDLESHQGETFATGDMLKFANNVIFLPWD